MNPLIVKETEKVSKRWYSSQIKRIMPSFLYNLTQLLPCFASLPDECPVPNKSK